MTEDVLLLLSGGLDSSVLLWHLQASGQRVRALSIDYGQTHRRETDRARQLAGLALVAWDLLSLPGLLDLWRDASALTGQAVEPHGRATVVPGRNLLFLALATSRALSLGIPAVALAMHAGDHDLYPDCRPAFVDAAATVLLLCSPEQRISVRAPFLAWTRERIIRRGLDLRCPLGLTRSCYRATDLPCGDCEACRGRREAFALLGEVDPALTHKE